ncbi:hypothetical protein N8I77_011296 [Diaporthe amygdali]|uniref:Uncharacterized protein n=1 Tax=Phomopsis amygdali TaxID=1214568 RepID=A0AAD9VYC3_PHOAM|nr:hypothetical protein N8I77_011296 [Diaporthe amygdali]
MAGYEMDAAPEELFMNTFIDNLRSEKTRLWIKTIVLSILLGFFAICTAVLSILYGTQTCPVSSSAVVPTMTASPEPTTVPSTVWTSVTVLETASADPDDDQMETDTLTTTEFRTIILTFTAATTATTTATKTSVSTKTVTVSGYPGPRTCQSGMTIVGQRLIDQDSDYYTKLMNFIMRNQPNSAHKVDDDEGFKKLAINSLWRCAVITSITTLPPPRHKMPNGPGAASISTIESIIKPAEATGGSGKTKCIECDGYECCCIPIPCVVM